MLRLITAVCLVTATLGNPLTEDVPKLDGRIVGGEPVDVADFPWQLSLLHSGSHMCGASIIGATWALTAAHCTNDQTAHTLTLRAGSAIINSGGFLYHVAEIVQHYLFDLVSYDYDFSLLRVEPAFTFGVGVAVIDLPDHDEAIFTGTNTTVSGWGRISEGGAVSDQLQAMTIPTISRTICNNSPYPGSITWRMICAYAPNLDSCQGDDGGPMVYNSKLIGVVSWGSGCARPGRPGVYAKVADVRPWIAQHTGI